MVGANPAHSRVLTLRLMRRVALTDSCLGPSAEKDLLVSLYNLRCRRCPPRFRTEAGVRSASRAVGMQLQRVSFAVCLNYGKVFSLRLVRAKMLSLLRRA